VTDTVVALTLTAAGIGFFHTLIGPDHYLPFVLMGRAGGWSQSKTMAVTIACGAGHVLSSVVLGTAGIAIGLAVAHMQTIEETRGHAAAWALIAFGIAYGAWGLRRALRNRPHGHLHTHADGTVHSHEHAHVGEHSHVHGNPKSITPWALFTIFVLGPCEPLIPLLMVPAVQHSTAGVIWVSSVFGVVTLATMVAMVSLCRAGVSKLKLGPMERFSHALAGAALAMCGIVIRIFGV
jgi:sulfite exporter TauE/SafE